MTSVSSYHGMSDDEDDPRVILSDDEEPRAIEEIVEGEIEAFNDGEAVDGAEDMDFLFGKAGEGTEAPADAAIKAEKEKKARKSMGPKMNTDRLKGPLGVMAVDNFFKDFKMRGRGHEKDDLDEILKRMQAWAHRMYPRFAFTDCVRTIENLGQKIDMKIFMKRHRNQPILPDEMVVTQFDDEDEAVVEGETRVEEEERVDDPAPVPDPFDNFVHPASPPLLSAEQLECIRLNREAAVQRRLAKMREREMQAAGGLSTTQTPGDAVLVTDQTSRDTVVESNQTEEDNISVANQAVEAAHEMVSPTVSAISQNAEGGNSAANEIVASESNQTAENGVSVPNKTVGDLVLVADEIPMEVDDETSMEEISTSDEMQMEVALPDSETLIEEINASNQTSTKEISSDNLTLVET